jgi:type II secretion system protein G
MKYKGGFTLIELLIVLIIIGVLATLAIPQYQNYVEKARAAEALTMIGAIKTAEATYRLDNNYYTSDLTELTDITGFGTNNDDASTRSQYWYYTGASPLSSATGYQIQATRSTLKGGTGETIYFTWSDETGATWTGTHPGKPK